MRNCGVSFVWRDSKIILSEGSRGFGGLEHFLFFHILGMSSSQLAFIFFRGIETTNQMKYIRSHELVCYILIMWSPKFTPVNWVQTGYITFGLHLFKYIINRSQKWTVRPHSLVISWWGSRPAWCILRAPILGTGGTLWPGCYGGIPYHYILWYWYKYV